MCTSFKGAWVIRPVSKWVKATNLLAKHNKSDWHKAAVEKQKLSLLTEKHGSIVEQIISVDEEEKQHNRTFLKKVVQPDTSVVYLSQLHLSICPLFCC